MIFDTCTGGYFMIAVDPRIGTKIVLYQIYVRSVDLSNRLVSEHPHPKQILDTVPQAL